MKDNIFKNKYPIVADGSQRINGGYTLLFSIIVASIVLSIAAFILSVSRKQFILASAARDSTVAIYAADSGIQCAIAAYKNGMLVTSGDAIINCNGNSITLGYDNNAGPIDGTDFSTDFPISCLTKSNNICGRMIIPLPNNTCATIDIMQGYVNNSGSYSHKTIIDSRGYNIANSGPCDTGNNPVNPRAVERAIRLQYRD